MNCFVWNVRGLNKPLKQHAVYNRIKDNRARVVCLIETRVKHNQRRAILEKWFNGWKSFHNYVEADNGRIWVLWKDYLQLSLVCTTDQSITASFSADNYLLFLTAIYGRNTGSERKRLWKHLQGLHKLVADHSWILVGDFNVIASSFESSDFRVPLT